MKQKDTSTEAGLEYRKENIEVGRRKQWIEEQCKSIENEMTLGTIPSRLSPRANSISQQRKNPDGKHSCSKPVD